jgi:antitoxin Phd
VGKIFSIAKAKDKLPSIIHEVEDGTSVRLTRYGRPVAIIMSIEEYEQSVVRGNDFWDELMSFRNSLKKMV